MSEDSSERRRYSVLTGLMSGRGYSRLSQFLTGLRLLTTMVKAHVLVSSEIGRRAQKF